MTKTITIIKDEMGLGKTLQSISVLVYQRQFQQCDGPHLIVVPKSTLSNWMNEIAILSKFAWNYLIIDEAHRLKNEQSLFSKTVRTFEAKYRLLLTGKFGFLKLILCLILIQLSCGES